MTGQMASEGTSRGRQRPSHHLKACLRGFQMVYRAHILCEELKLKIVATSKNFEAVQPLFQSEAAWGHSSDLKPPRPPVYDTQMPCPDLRMSNLTLASVLNFWGRSRPPEAIWGRGQIQHPEYHIWGSRRFEVARVASSGLGLKKRSYSLKIFTIFNFSSSHKIRWEVLGPSGSWGTKLKVWTPSTCQTLFQPFWRYFYL